MCLRFVEEDYCSEIKILGVSPLVEAGPCYPLIRLQALGAGQVSISIPNAAYAVGQSLN